MPSQMGGANFLEDNSESVKAFLADNSSSVLQLKNKSKNVSVKRSHTPMEFKTAAAAVDDEY